MFDIGWTELLVIGIVALIVIGPKDLPVMFQQLGRFTGKLRMMAREFQSAMEQAAKESGASDVAADLKSQYGLDYHWDDDGVLSFKRPGLSGQLTLARKQVTVEVRLGLLLSPLKASFEREIQDFFDQRFAAHG